MISEKLQQASFKNVPFYWRRLNTQLGKKSVTHNYPGTGRRFVEDMGTLPRTFTIEASVSGTIGTDEYVQNKQALENALASPGPGYLVHPTYGRVLVTAKPASCTEELRRLGEATYSLTFEKSDEVSRPVGTTSTARQIELKRQQSISEIIETATDAWTAPESPGVFGIVAQNITNLSTQMDGVVSKVYAAKSGAYKVLNTINSISSGSTEYVTAPLGLFNAINSVFEAVLDMDDDFSSQLDRLTSFFGDSADSGPGQGDGVGQMIDAISYETEQAEANRVAQNEASNMMALVNAYSAISKIDFQSTDELDSFVDKVESQYQIMIDSTLMQGAMRDTVLSLRVAARDVVEQKRLLTQSIITAEFKTALPLNVALFMYSGNIDDSDYVTSLNLNQDIVFASGEVELLQ